MSDSEASDASDDVTHSECDESQRESDREFNNNTDDEDFDEEQGPEATAEPSAGKVKKPRLLWVTLKQWNLREQDKEEVMYQVQELANLFVSFQPDF